MSRSQEVTYTVDFALAGNIEVSLDVHPAGPCVPRIARLMALAIRFEGMVRAGTVRNYAELAQLGRVTRARMTQIVKLLDLAPDIQEQILFLPPTKGLNERNLRFVVRCADWTEQRRRFQEMCGR